MSPWQADFCARLRAAGIGCAQALAWYYERYGLKGGEATGICPLCAADRFLLQRGLIPAPPGGTSGN